MNEWKDEVIDRLVILHIYNATHEDNPRKALFDLINFENEIALDPSVSHRAWELVDQGKSEMLQTVLKSMRGETL
jgi:hypothetical protein